MASLRAAKPGSHLPVSYLSSRKITRVIAQNEIASAFVHNRGRCRTFGQLRTTGEDGGAGESVLDGFTFYQRGQSDIARRSTVHISNHVRLPNHGREFDGRSGGAGARNQIAYRGSES